MTSEAINPKTRNLILYGMCAAITCVLAPISVPLPGDVPLSLCTFAVMLSAVLLGAKGGAISQLIYVLLGCVGLPVFAGYKGGLGVVLGVTGGYIIGYIPMAFVIGLLCDKFARSRSGASKIAVMIASMIAGTAVLYTIGTAWFIAQTHMTLGAAMAACVLPFLPLDLVKIVAVALVEPPIEAALNR